jgi:branched-chain amino acid aminotransferase
MILIMDEQVAVQLFAVEEGGLRPLPVPPGVAGFDGLYDGVALGVYSALRTFAHNRFLYLGDHIARTEKSMRLLGWSYAWDVVRFRRMLHTAVTQYPGAECRVRWDILAQPARALGTESRELLALAPFAGVPPQLYEAGVRVGLATELHREAPLVKTADFAQARQAYQAAHDAGVYEYLMLDGNGRMLEGASTNFYAVRQGVLYTAGSGVLEGITRKIVLQLAEELGIPVCLQAVALTEIGQLSEAALSGSSRGFLPVVQIGEMVVGNGRPGPVARQIMTAYNSFVAHAVQTAVAD